MKYMTCAEASALMGITPRRIQQMCKSGEISGAVKKGRSWMIPDNGKSMALPKKNGSHRYF